MWPTWAGIRRAAASWQQLALSSFSVGAYRGREGHSKRGGGARGENKNEHIRGSMSQTANNIDLNEIWHPFMVVGLDLELYG